MPICTSLQLKRTTEMITANQNKGILPTVLSNPFFNNLCVTIVPMKALWFHLLEEQDAKFTKI